MIKQFNFYDIYGYLLPGVLLLGILWLPVGVLTRSWPEEDLSKALFLAALAYIVGHLVQTVANPLVPSKVMDKKRHLRAPSDLFLDNSDKTFTGPFKGRLAKQVATLFGLDVAVLQDGDGAGEISKDRGTAFYQARSYLIAKKAANYVEQFEGLYAMMRGLACSFRAGAGYLAGWALAFHRNCAGVGIAMAVLTSLAVGGTFVSVEWDKPSKRSPWAGYLWLGVFFGAGFWASYIQPIGLGQRTSSRAELILWASVLAVWVAGAKCLSSYREFAGYFAASVWRDFSACLSYQEVISQASDSSEAEDSE